MTELKCKYCKKSYSPTSLEYVCECFAPLEWNPDLSKDIDYRKRILHSSNDIWRYADFLPDKSLDSPLPVGNSPLVEAPILAKRLNIGKLWIKNETSLPTHSFKDRVTAVATNQAHRIGLTTIACASTGNLASAVAASAGANGLQAVVFVPETLEPEKILAAQTYGARLVALEGDYDFVNRHCIELAEKQEWGFVNINLRPFYAEGSKTIAFEIVEQLGWRVPENIVCPIASGSLFTKLGKGIQEWNTVGLVEGAPSFFGAQASGCDPVAESYRTSLPVRPQRADTIAKSLAIGTPADGDNAVALAADSGGAVESVNDKEVIEGIRLLAETTGIFTETAGGVTIGTLKKLAASDRFKDQEVVAVITGDGLKTLSALS